MITDKFINADLYITKEEHAEIHHAPNRIADDIIENGHSVPDFATAQISSK